MSARQADRRQRSPLLKGASRKDVLSRSAAPGINVAKRINCVSMRQTKPGTDEYAVMIDARDALEIGAAAEFHDYHRSWQHS